MITIPLSKPVEWHGKQLTEIELREPSAMLFMQIGDPTTLIRRGDDSAYFYHDNEVISKYLDKLITADGGISVLSVLPAIDGMAIKAALVNFFLVAAQGIST